MKKLLLLLAILPFIISCNGQERKTVEKSSAKEEIDSFLSNEDCIQYMIEKEKDTIYTIETNKSDDKFGKGIYRNTKMIIPPIYQDIISLGNHYYQLYEFWKNDIQKEKLIRIDPYTDAYIDLPFDFYFGTLSNGLQVFEQKNSALSGLLKNESKIMLPFIYESINQIGNYIFCKKPDYEGVEIYDLYLNKLPDLELVDYDYLSCKHNLIKAFKSENNDKYEAKIGLINLNLQWITECKYYDIKNLNSNDDFFIIIERHKNKKDLLYGIMNKNGDEVIPPKYLYIDQKPTDSLIKIKLKENENYELISLNELLERNKQK